MPSIVTGSHKVSFKERCKNGLIAEMVISVFAFALLFFLGRYAIKEIDRDPDTQLQIRVLKTELDKARKECHTDSILLFDSKGRYYTVPCSVINEPVH